MLVCYFLAAAGLIGLFVTASRGQSSARTLFAWGGLFMVAILVIAFHFGVDAYLYRGQVNHYVAPMTVEEAKEAGCPIPLPPEAHNVQFVTATSADGTRNYVRFEAPVSVCRRQLKQVIKTSEGKSPDLIPLAGPPERLEAPLRSTAWFDIEKIAHGETASFESSLGRVWIDTDRGIFYFQQEP